MKALARPILLPALALAALVVAPSSSAAADWKGEQKTVDGVVHVENPAEAIDPGMTIDLEEVFRLGGWDGGEDEFFGVISDIAVDEQGNLYVLDAQLHEVKVYDSEGNFLDVLGREGEGPGEFRGGSNLFWLPNGDLAVVQAFPSRIVTLKRDGTPGADFELQQPEGSGFMLVQAIQEAGDHLAVTYSFREFDQDTQEFVATTWLSLFDPESGAEVERLHSHVGGMDFKDPVVSETSFDNFSQRVTVSDDGMIYAPEDLTDYRILAWNPDGTLQRVITREYTVFERTQEEIDELLEIYRGFTPQGQVPPNTKFEVNDVHPAIDREGLQSRPDGSLWVLTSRGSLESGDESLGTFDVYDPRGRFVRQATLNGQCDNMNDRIMFVGDHVFVVTEFISSAMAAQGGGAGAAVDEGEEEAEPMAIICYRSADLDRAAGIPDRPADSR
jgi:hypothetical protein